MRFVRSFVLATGLIAVIGSPAAAQVRIGLSAFAGGFLPTGDVPVPGVSPIDLSQDVGPVFGGRLTVMFSRLGLEAEAGYALSGVDEFMAQREDLPIDAGIFLGSLNLVFVVYEAPLSPLSVYINGGAGIVSRGGDYFNFFDDTADPAGSVGIGLRFGLSPLVGLRFDLRDYISSFQPAGFGGNRKESKVQNDLIATLGLEFSFSPAP